MTASDEAAHTTAATPTKLDKGTSLAMVSASLVVVCEKEGSFQKVPGILESKEVLIIMTARFFFFFSRRTAAEVLDS